MSLVLKNICYIYDKSNNESGFGLKNINMTVNDNEFIGIIGHTGSGKSTLVQHLNGLIKADSGIVEYNGDNIYEKGYKLSELRKKIGLVFQYPEYQLFKNTIIEDAAFGPYNKWKDKELAKKKAKEALLQVGIEEKLFEDSPFELSGGQKRRVAIAGVLAMEPDILVLDEPTAGLDPKGREEILGLLKNLQKIRDISVVLVSHSMEDVAKYVDRIIVMNDGTILYDDVPKKVFEKYKELEKIGLSAPAVTYLPEKIREIDEDNFCDEAGDNNGIITTVDEAVEYIKRLLDRKQQC